MKCFNKDLFLENYGFEYRSQRINNLPSDRLRNGWRFQLNTLTFNTPHYELHRIQLPSLHKETNKGFQLKKSWVRSGKQQKIMSFQIESFVIFILFHSCFCGRFSEDCRWYTELLERDCLFFWKNTYTQSWCFFKLLIFLPLL